MYIMKSIDEIFEYHLNHQHGRAHELMNKKLRSVMVIILIALATFIVKTSLESNSSNKEEMDRTVSNQSVTNSVQVHEDVEENSGKYKIVIDPGHGGDDPGAEGASGSYEKEFTLSLSNKIKAALEDEPDIQVHMTREEDVFLSSETRERPKFANELQADLFISIHANTFADPTVSGTETFYYDEDSRALADIIHRHVVSATRFRDRGVTEENFFVLTDTHMPAVLLEIGYLTNPQEEQELLTESFQLTVAQAIADGIKEFLDRQVALERFE